MGHAVSSSVRQALEIQVTAMRLAEVYGEGLRRLFPGKPDYVLLNAVTDALQKAEGDPYEQDQTGTSASRENPAGADSWAAPAPQELIHVVGSSRLPVGTHSTKCRG